MLQNKIPQLTTWLVATLGFISILGPFGSDAYLPALPIMGNDLANSPTAAQTTLTAFAIGLALGQLLMGTFSDALGRRRLIILGPTVMGFASLLGAMSQNIFTLFAACVLIGFSSSTGMVVGRAQISDLATGLSASRAFSQLGLFAGIGPIAGPLFGAVILGFADWRAIFVGLSVMAFVLAALAIFQIPETLPKEKRQSANVSAIFKAAKSILKNRMYLQHAIILWCTVGIMFAYISSSPFIIQNILGLTPFNYTLVFGTNGIGIMIAGAVATAVAKKVSPRKVLGWGIGLQLSGAGILLGTWIMGTPSVWNILPALFIMVSSMGLMFGPATALGLTQVRERAGTALAIQGFIQFLIAGVMATLVGLAGPMEFWPLALIVTVASLTSLTFWIRTKRTLAAVL